MDRHTARLICWQWIGTALLLAVIAFAVFCSGCSARQIVYIPPGKALRLREDIEAAVWGLDKNGEPVAGYAVLKNGWYVLPLMSQEAKDGSH